VTERGRQPASLSKVKGVGNNEPPWILYSSWSWFPVSALVIGGSFLDSSHVNPKRLILAILAMFAFVWHSDGLIHGVWLKNDYAAAMGLWRPEADMQAHLGWMMLGQLLATVAFVMLYAKGFAAMNCLRCACLFGLFMALFSQANTLITYAVQPIAGSLAAKWFIAAVGQGVLLGLIVFFVYKPKPGDGKTDYCEPKK
jgi:hypothetical protein